MSVTSGFFDYKLVDNVPDRSYNSDELSRIFEGIITPGVFMHVGNKLEVVVGEGMTVRVRSGRCWFDNKWVNNDADLPLTITGTTAAGRKDTIVVELNLDPDDINGRWATIKVVRGTESAITPPVSTTTLKQYILAVINVPPNTTQSLTQAMIVSNVGTGGQYPVNWIGTPLTGFTAEYYYQHWQQEFDDWFGNEPLSNGIKQAWSTWFANAQGAWSTWFENAQSAWTTWYASVQTAWVTWYENAQETFAQLLSDKDDEFEVWMDTMHGKLDESTATSLQQQIDQFAGRYDFTIAVNDWVYDSTNHFWTVERSARYYNNDSEPILWPEMPDGSSVTDKVNIRKNFAKIVSAKTSKDVGAINGKIIFTAFKEIDVPLTIHAQGGWYGRVNTDE